MHSFTLAKPIQPHSHLQHLQTPRCYIYRRTSFGCVCHVFSYDCQMNAHTQLNLMSYSLSCIWPPTFHLTHIYRMVASTLYSQNIGEFIDCRLCGRRVRAVTALIETILLWARTIHTVVMFPFLSVVVFFNAAPQWGKEEADRVWSVCVCEREKKTVIFQYNMNVRAPTGVVSENFLCTNLQRSARHRLHSCCLLFWWHLTSNDRYTPSRDLAAGTKTSVCVFERMGLWIVSSLVRSHKGTSPS